VVAFCFFSGHPVRAVVDYYVSRGPQRYGNGRGVGDERRLDDYGLLRPVFD
jgi:hypothetical protein